MQSIALPRLVAVAAVLFTLTVGCAGADEVVAVVANEPTSTPAPAQANDPVTPDATLEPAAATPAPPAPEPTAEPDPTPTVEIPEFIVPTGIVPARIEIQSIGVDAPVIDLNLSGLEPEVPTDFADAGWYVQTRLPGEIGPSVIAGHIDSQSGPAVFALLDQLVPGDEITVFDAQDEARTFVVIDAEQYGKANLPDEVFGFGAPEPELRLITCGGTFDPESGHYRDNYVVFARQVPDAGA